MKTQALRVILVDDHQVLREGLKFMLRNEPDVSIVAEADNGIAGLEAIAQFDPDVVLLDMQMPGAGGLETLSLIRQKWRTLPVLIFTIYDDPEYVEEALHAGASGYLLKNVTSQELLRALRAVHAGWGYLQAEITRPVLERFTRAGPSPVSVHLSPREIDVLRLLAEGLSNKQIAKHLKISEATVKGYLSQLFEKLGAIDRAHAVALALRSRLID